ncbi:hypothetical protein B0H11DRAFT_1714802 [Mycena galericulata]|nr:hypothetical protein B0H11DRAFT_1714802 [Mycena galericulata]
MLREHNPYVHLFRHSHEVLRDLGDDVEDHSVRLRVAPGVHARRGNLPTADEVAVILPGDQSRAEPRDIILRRRNGPLMQISDLHAAYTPLYYVLLFPRGESGWHPDMKLNEPDKDYPGRLTQTRYVAYRLHQRKDEPPTILRGCRLLQRYMVDMWASADQNRL